MVMDHIHLLHKYYNQLIACLYIIFILINFLYLLLLDKANHLNQFLLLLKNINYNILIIQKFNSQI